jgi:hypothetical protein
VISHVTAAVLAVRLAIELCSRLDYKEFSIATTLHNIEITKTGSPSCYQGVPSALRLLAGSVS